MFSAAPSSSYSSSVPAWGPSHGRPFSTNFSNVSPFHGLQLFTSCSSTGPSHRVQSFKNRLLQRGYTTGSQVLPANLLQRGFLSPQIRRSCQEPAPARATHRITASLGHPPAPTWRPPWALSGDLLNRGPPWLQGDSLPHHGLLHGLQGNLCPSAWSTSSPSFFTVLGVCRAVSLTYSHSSLYPAAVFSPLLKYVVSQRHYHHLLISLALASNRSILELAGSGSVRHEGSFSQLLTEATVVAPPLPKTCHANPLHYLN